jgi:hypothetical protein
VKPGRDTAPGFFMPAYGAKGIEDGVRAALCVCPDIEGERSHAI